MPSKVCDEITHLISNFNGRTVDIWKWISFLTTHFIIDEISNTYGIKINPY